MTVLFRTVTTAVSALAMFLLPHTYQEQHQHPPPEKIGEVSFPVSCLPGSQNLFNRGVALLHSFAYSAAENTFLEIVQADPKCAMAHWGVAISFYHQMWEPPLSPADLQRGQWEINEARVLNGVSAREKGFIGALALFYKGAPRVPYMTRALAYEHAMSAVAAQNPTDTESQVFYALALLATASPSDRSHTNQKHAAAILEPIYKQYPEHPGVAHYLIHAYDSPELARLGLPAARAYAQIAPSAPHALHMPSHIFTQLGLWDDSIKSNIAARAAAYQQGDIGEELHAMDYLMYAYLQEARYGDASQVLQELRLRPNLPLGQFKVGYAATAIPIRYAMERQQWAEAAAVAPSAKTQPQVSAMTYWSRAVGLARDGKPDAATPALRKLNELLDDVRQNKDDYWMVQVQIQIDEAKAWIAHATRQDEAAVALLRSAADMEDSLEKRPVTPGPVIPAREQLGDLFLEMNQASRAVHEFEVSLATSPRRRGSLSGAARAARIAGDSTKANEFDRDLQALSTHDEN